MPGKIFIVEGIWKSGKTTLIKDIRKEEKIEVILEPSHLNARKEFKSQDTIDHWYANAHMKNLTKAINKKGSGNIFIERSVISSIAFRNAYIKKSDKLINKSYNYFKDLLEKEKNKGQLVNIILLDPEDILYTENYVTNHKYLKKFKHSGIINKYKENIKKCLVKLSNERLINLVINTNIKDIIQIINHVK